MPVPRVTVRLSLVIFWTLEISMILREATHMRSWFNLKNYYLLFRYVPLVRLMSGCRDIIDCIAPRLVH